MRDEEDAQTRSVLLETARALISENPSFSLKTLLDKTGVSRAHFRRCFADKEQLLGAVTGEGVRSLDQILEAAQPAVQTLRSAVGSDIAPAPAMAPVPDAWLERRLRVFERALAGLEKRQEKSEEMLGYQLALIGEQLASLARPAAPVPQPAPLPRAEPEEHKPIAAVEAKPAEIPLAEPAAPEPQQAAPAQSHLVDIHAEELAPATQAFVEEIAAVPGPVDEKEIIDFIAHARRVAQNAAAQVERIPPQPSFNTRWLIWSGVVLIVLLFCAGVLIANGALGGTAGATPVATSSVSHRHVAQNDMSRLMALADSGNATAQTVLAMDYLNGRGVAGDNQAAKRWSLAAASQGQPLAQYLLGTLYLEGDKDEGEAVRWFRAAAGQGNVKAMHNLAIAYAEGLGVDKDPVQAVQWFVRAAEQGYRDSQFDLAVLYERGLGVPQSARSALKWYLIAAAHGDTPSADRAAFLKQQMDPAETKLAADEAASFVPQRALSLANETPVL